MEQKFVNEQNYNTLKKKFQRKDKTKKLIKEKKSKCYKFNKGCIRVKSK